MAGPTNLRLLTDFFNKIGQKATLDSRQATSASPPKPDIAILVQLLHRAAQAVELIQEM